MDKYTIHFYRDERAKDCAGFKTANTEFGRDYIADNYAGPSIKRVIINSRKCDKSGVILNTLVSDKLVNFPRD